MADKTPLTAAGGASAARPGVLSLNIRERAALYAAYMPFLRGGGIFIPTLAAVSRSARKCSCCCR